MILDSATPTKQISGQRIEEVISQIVIVTFVIMVVASFGVATVAAIYRLVVSGIWPAMRLFGFSLLGIVGFSFTYILVFSVIFLMKRTLEGLYYRCRYGKDAERDHMKQYLSKPCGHPAQLPSPLSIGLSKWRRQNRKAGVKT